MPLGPRHTLQSTADRPTLLRKGLWPLVTPFRGDQLFTEMGLVSVILVHFRQVNSEALLPLGGNCGRRMRVQVVAWRRRANPLER